MDKNILEYIYDEFRSYYQNNSTININFSEVITSCIFAEELSKTNDENKAIEYYLWYNIFQYNASAIEGRDAKQKTSDFLKTLNLSMPTSEGFSFNVTTNDLSTSNISNTDFVDDLKNTIFSFQQNKNCKFDEWFGKFYKNLLSEDKIGVANKFSSVLSGYQNLPEILELILTNKPSYLSSFATSVLVEKNYVKLSEEVILKLENQLDIICHKTKKDYEIINNYLSILKNNILHGHAKNDSHAIFLSDLITEDDFNQQLANKVILDFHHELMNEDADLT